MRYSFRVAALTVCVVAICWSQAAAEWNEGDFAKWVQLPDLDTTGMDIHAWFLPLDTFFDFAVLDDFVCTSTGPITGFHFWASWLDDINTGGLATVDLFIRAADGPGGGPGTYLWRGEWGVHAPSMIDSGLEPVPMNVTERVYAVGGPEDFYEARDAVSLGSDTVVYQYNCYIDEEVAFVQAGSEAAPVTYWIHLAVDAALVDTEFVGAKTRDPSAQYGQAARFVNGATWTWDPLVYPTGHPLAGQSIDLAFVITPEPATVALMAIGTLGTILLGKRR